MSTKEYISVTDTAKLVRADLKKHFPGVRFSVRSSKYAGGASLDIRWTDGPTLREVDDVVQRYAGATFDGMTDSTTYHDAELDGRVVHFGADYVITQRDISRELEDAISATVCEYYGHEPIERDATGRIPYVVIPNACAQYPDNQLPYIVRRVAEKQYPYDDGRLLEQARAGLPESQTTRLS